MTLSVLIRDQRGVETIHGGVRDVRMIPQGFQPRADEVTTMHPGIGVRFHNGTDIFVDWPRTSSSDDIAGAGVYVMNDDGKTVAKYRF